MYNLQCSPLRRPNGPQGRGFVALVLGDSSVYQPLLSISVQSIILGTRNKIEKVQALKDLISYWFLWEEKGEMQVT